MRRQKLPPAEVLAELRAQGWTWAMLQQAYGVSHGTVHNALARAGLIEHLWTRYELLPWPKIESEDTQSHILRMLRYAYWLKIGKRVPDKFRAEDHKWVAWIEQAQLVVAYT